MTEAQSHQTHEAELPPERRRQWSESVALLNDQARKIYDERAAHADVSSTFLHAEGLTINFSEWYGRVQVRIFDHSTRRRVMNHWLGDKRPVLLRRGQWEHRLFRL